MIEIEIPERKSSHSKGNSNCVMVSVVITQK